MARRSSTADPALSQLQTGHDGAVKTCEQTVNRLLSGALRRRRLQPLRLDRAIFTRVADGLLVQAAIPLPREVAKRHLRKRAYPVGVLIATHPLFDPISGVGLKPGAALVELRPVLDGAFAFDFIGGDDRIRLSTPASLSDAGRAAFDAMPPDQPISAARFSLLDIDIMDGSDPDDPFPPGSAIVLCVSFLHWVKCWIRWLPGPTFPQPPILV